MAFDEERAGESLRTLMREAELPPSDSDVDAAVRTGRRQVGRRRIVAAAAAVVGLTATSSVAAVALTRDTAVELVADERAVSCEAIEYLPIPPGYTRGHVGGADGSGRFLAGTAQVSPEHKADPVLWKDKVPTVLDVPGVVTLPTAVNGRGDVIGYGTGERGAEDPQMAWLYRDGRARTLKPPAGLRAPHAYAINDRGDIVGGAQDWSGRTYAVVWPAGAPERPRRLDGPAGATAYGVGADGTVVGAVGQSYKRPAATGHSQPYLWTSAGRGRQLPLPPGFAGGTALSVHDGWVLGYVFPDQAPSETREDTELTPVRWQVEGGPAQVVAEPAGTLLDSLGSTGWLIANTIPTAWSAPVLIHVDGRVRRAEPPGVHPTQTGLKGEPIPDPVLGTQAVWANESKGQLTVIGNGSPEDSAPRPTIWRCQ